MSGKFKITLSNGDTYETADEQEFDAMMTDFTADGLKPTWTDEPDTYVDEMNSAGSNTYVDEMNSAGSNAEPIAAPRTLQDLADSKRAVGAPTVESYRDVPGVGSFWDRASKYASDQADYLGSGEVKKDLVDVARAVRHGVSAGWDDELGRMFNEPVAQENAESAARSPNLWRAFNVAGNVATTAALPIVRGSKIAQGVTQAALGAFQGAGEAESGQKLRGSLIGGSVGAALPMAGNYLQGLAQKLGKKALALRGQVLSPTIAQTKELQERFGSDLADEQLGAMLEQHVKPNLILPRTPGDYRDALAASLNKTGDQISSTVRAAGAAGGDAAVPAAQENLIGAISQEAEKATQRVGQIQSNVAAQLGRYVKQMSAKGQDPYQPLRVNPKTTPKTLEDFWKQRQSLDADVGYSSMGGVPDAAKSQAASLAADANRGLLEDIVDKSAPALGARFRTLNKAYGDQAKLKDVAARAAATDANGSPVGSFVRNAVLGGALGAGGGLLTDSDPLKSALVGAGAFVGTGTFPAAQRAINSPAGRDLGANVARLASQLAKRSLTTDPRANSAIRSAVTSAAVFTDEARLKQAVRAGTYTGPYAAELRSALGNDEDFDRKANTALQDPSVRAALKGKDR